jgi:hypothetical protein
MGESDRFESDDSSVEEGGRSGGPSWMSSRSRERGDRGDRAEISSRFTRDSGVGGGRGERVAGAGGCWDHALRGGGEGRSLTSVGGCGRRARASCGTDGGGGVRFGHWATGESRGGFGGVGSSAVRSALEKTAGGLLASLCSITFRSRSRELLASGYSIAAVAGGALLNEGSWLPSARYTHGTAPNHSMRSPSPSGKRSLSVPSRSRSSPSRSVSVWAAAYASRRAITSCVAVRTRR